MIKHIGRISLAERDKQKWTQSNVGKIFQHNLDIENVQISVIVWSVALFVFFKELPSFFAILESSSLPEMASTSKQ